MLNLIKDNFGGYMFSRKNIAMVVAELVGTGLLTGVVLAVSRSPIGLPYFVALAAGLTLGMLVLTVGRASGAHVNPAVTLGLWTARKIGTIKAVIYIVAQFVGAILAWRLYTYLVNAPVKNIAGSTFDWRVMVAELGGAAILTFGVATAVSEDQDSTGKQAATVGLSIALGIMVASSASNGIINPAVALGVQSWSKAYVFGPLVGGVVGAMLYALVFAPEGLKIATAKLTVPKAASTATATKKKAPAKKKATSKKRK